MLGAEECRKARFGSCERGPVSNRTYAALLLLSSSVACGNATPVPVLPPLPVAATAPAEPEPAVAAPREPAAPPSEREVLIDGVRRGEVLDELDGWTLTEGSGTVALVGPDGHVRASHRFAFGSYGAVAAFVDGAYAVVANGDTEGFRSAWANAIVRWELDADTTEHLASLGYGIPTVARVGGRVVAAGDDDMPVVVIGTSTLVPAGDLSPEIVWPASRPPWCLVTSGSHVLAIARPTSDGEVTFERMPEDELVVSLEPTELAVVFPGHDDVPGVLVALPERTPVAIDGVREGEAPIDVIRLGTGLWVRFRGPEGERDLALPAMTWGDAVRHGYVWEPRPASLADLGGFGIVGLAFAPRTRRLALATSGRTLILSEAGVAAELEGGRWISWSPSEAVLRVADEIRPLEGPSRDGDSVLVAGRFYYDESDVPEEELRFDDWRNEVAALVPGAAAPPPPSVEPVCGPPGTGRRCVRIHVDGVDARGWEVFDPARPSVVLATIHPEEARPPTAATTFVSPGGRWVRDFGYDGTRIVPADGHGDGYETIQVVVELDDGWIWIDPNDTRVLHALSYTRGRLRTRSFGDDAELRQLTVIDGASAAVLVSDDEVEVVRFSDLGTVRTIRLSSDEPASQWECTNDGLVDAFDEAQTVYPFPCPTDDEHDYLQAVVTVSADRAFFAAASLGDVARIHRVADGAELFLRISAAGYLASVRGGLFEVGGDLVDHVVVRDAGPVRSAAITFGADARARFERPGLVASFFRGEPLPDVP